MIIFINHEQMELGLGQAEAEKEPEAGRAPAAEIAPEAVLVLETVLESVIVLGEPETALAAETVQAVLRLLHHLDEHQQLSLEHATVVLEEGILEAGRVGQQLSLYCVSVDGKEDYP